MLVKNLLLGNLVSDIYPGIKCVATTQRNNNNVIDIKILRNYSA